MADITLPEMLNMEVVRSKIARGNIVSVNGGITASDISFYLGSSGEGYGEGNVAVKQPVLAEKYISYYGQPVAVVYDSSKYVAKDLAESVEIKVEQLEPVVTLDQALKLPPIHPGIKSNRASEFTLGKEYPDKGDVEVEDELYLERVVADPLETRGIVSFYRDGILNVWILYIHENWQASKVDRIQGRAPDGQQAGKRSIWQVKAFSNKGWKNSWAEG